MAAILSLLCRFTNETPLPNFKATAPDAVVKLRSLTPDFKLHRLQSPVTNIILYAVHPHEFTTQRIPTQTRQVLPSKAAPLHNETRVSQRTRMFGENLPVTMALPKRNVIAIHFKALAP